MIVASHDGLVDWVGFSWQILLKNSRTNKSITASGSCSSMAVSAYIAYISVRVDETYWHYALIMDPTAKTIAQQRPH